MKGLRIIKMRCTICNTLLTDQETSRKYNDTHPLSGEYLDTSTQCLISIIDIEPTLHIEDLDDE